MPRDWSRYWRSPDEPLEAMHAHFERHVYHRHSHETYSFGVTETGAQSFTCRGSARTSAAGMVGLPLFADPVVSDPVLARNLRDLHRALLGGALALQRDELLAAAVRSAVRRAAVPARPSAVTAAAASRADAGPIARRVRELIASAYLEDITASDLVAATGRSRFSVHRAFTHVYGMAPSDYQRQLRLRAARRLISQGRPISEAAARAGFADQSHLSRWFSRCYGVTPGGYQRAAEPGDRRRPRSPAAGRFHDRGS